MLQTKAQVAPILTNNMQNYICTIKEANVTREKERLKTHTWPPWPSG